MAGNQDHGVLAIRCGEQDEVNVNLVVFHT